MSRHRPTSLAAAAVVGLAVLGGTNASAKERGDWLGDHPSAWHEIKPSALPKSFATQSASNASQVVPAPAGAMPKVPTGFAVTRFAAGLDGPRTIRVAPNGDIFVAETEAGIIRILRAKPGASKTELDTVFATDLEGPFGMAFYPPGPNPKWLYVANTNSILRFPYASGDTKAHGLPQTLVPQLVSSEGGHSTRDLRFSADGTRMFVSVGSGSNVGEGMSRLTGPELAAWVKGHPLGAAWDDEDQRADVLTFDPEGGGRSVFATGLRNCVGLAIQPVARVRKHATPKVSICLVRLWLPAWSAFLRLVNAAANASSGRDDQQRCADGKQHQHWSIFLVALGQCPVLGKLPM